MNINQAGFASSGCDVRFCGGTGRGEAPQAAPATTGDTSMGGAGRGEGFVVGREWGQTPGQGHLEDLW